MTTTATVSEFRENLSKYIDLVNEKGKKIHIIDGRKGKVLAEIRKPSKKPKKKEFDWDKHMEFVRNFKPIFTNEDVKQLKKGRQADEKRFRELKW